MICSIISVVLVVIFVYFIMAMNKAVEKRHRMAANKPLACDDHTSVRNALEDKLGLPRSIFNGAVDLRVTESAPTNEMCMQACTTLISKARHSKVGLNITAKTESGRDNWTITVTHHKEESQ